MKKMEEKNSKPIKLEVSKKTQCLGLYIFKEGKGMCQNDIVHMHQIGFCNEHMSISFEKKLIPKVIEALQNLSTVTEDNSIEFFKEMGLYFLDNGSDFHMSRSLLESDYKNCKEHSAVLEKKRKSK
jgi:hypothetical protein